MLQAPATTNKDLSSHVDPFDCSSSSPLNHDDFLDPNPSQDFSGEDLHVPHSPESPFSRSTSPSTNSLNVPNPYVHPQPNSSFLNPVDHYNHQPNNNNNNISNQQSNLNNNNNPAARLTDVLYPVYPYPVYGSAPSPLLPGTAAAPLTSQMYPAFVPQGNFVLGGGPAGFPKMAALNPCDEQAAVKHYLKRQKNNLAASKCREKKRKTELENVDKMGKLEKENAELRKELDSLRTQLQCLNDVIIRLSSKAAS